MYTCNHIYIFTYLHDYIEDIRGAKRHMIGGASSVLTTAQQPAKTLNTTEHLDTECVRYDWRIDGVEGSEHAKVLHVLG